MARNKTEEDPFLTRSDAGSGSTDGAVQMTAPKDCCSLTFPDDNGRPMVVKFEGGSRAFRCPATAVENLISAGCKTGI